MRQSSPFPLWPVILLLMATGVAFAALDDKDYAAALSHLQTGEFKEALSVIESELTQRPDSVLYLELKGRVLQAQGMYPAALTVFEKAREINPERFTLYFHMGECYFKQANWADAFTHYRLHAEADPPAIESRLKMIYCLTAVDNFAAALKLCSTLDPVDSYSPAYYFGKAALAHFRGNAEDFETALRQVRTIYGNDTFNLYMPDLLHLIKAAPRTKDGNAEGDSTPEAPPKAAP